ncbi:1-acyl-sn-glycerol-3-phosphate acyltransferase gamma-like [Phlebotomus argentipes]|uniref:1-acyl-sn-glycerol-3-phosphate acyltransferase gamma-like n=1 Tax=Phlebotomus argentipes TaxID=94469 RepID=UPI002892A0B3|nr:1-acyl-sn-glycerol-3-phosphate acyltransferase gamma-like [Phlebotomus argentipes]
MSWIRRIKQSTPVHLCLAVTFFTSGLIINATQLVLFITLKPFNKTLYRSLMFYLCYSLYSQIVFLTDWWSNSRIILFIDDESIKKHFGREHVIGLMNHTYEIDWLVGWSFCDKIRVLGNCKAYAKKVIQYLPIIGWAWKFSEFVFLERSFDKDKEMIGRQLANLLAYPDPIFLLLTPEGTRFTKEKHEASVKFAKEKGTTALTHHLIPRTRGFTTSLPHMRDKCPGILDVQLAFKRDDKVAPTVSNLLCGRGVTAYMYINRIDMRDVPEKEEEAAEWLQELFRQKDRMQESFHTHGDFFATSGVAPKPQHEFKPRLSTLLNTTGWAVVTLTPMTFYLIKMLLSGEIIFFSIGAGVLFTFHTLLQKAIGMSKISKGSTYGAVQRDHQ